MILIAELLKVKYIYWVNVNYICTCICIQICIKIFLLEECDVTHYWKSNLQLRDHLY